MRKRVIFFCFYSILFFACHKDDPIINPPVIEENNFSILPSSSEYLSHYHSKDSIIFEDSLGNELILRVKNLLNLSIINTSYFYDVHIPGDTIMHEYMSINDWILLNDDSMRYFFSLRLEPKLYIPNSDKNSFKAIDALIIYLAQPQSLPYSYSVFQKVIDLREYSNTNSYWDINKIEPSRTFLGTTFFEVEHTLYGNPKALVYFNKTYGIVAFSDYNHHTWRLKL